MRPKAIVYFERIIIATQFVGLVQLWLGWPQALGRAAMITDYPALYIIASYAWGFCVRIGLTLLVSRRRSKIAMWILIVLILLGVPAVVFMIASGLLIGRAIIGVAIEVGNFIAIGLLFTPAARGWMNNKMANADLHSTFS